MTREPGAGIERGKSQLQPARAEDAAYPVRMATADDIEALTELHCACFEPDDHLAVLLGKRYIRAMYRWQVSSKEACTVIVESGGEAIALAGVCDGPYMWPMFRACLGEFLVSLLTNPALLVNRRLWRRLIGSRDALDRRARRMLSRPGVAHLTTGAVDANFRGMGIIGKLVRGLEAISQSRGSLALCVGVRRSNHAIRRMFVKLGWSEVPASEGSELLYFITRLGRDPA